MGLELRAMALAASEAVATPAVAVPPREVAVDELLASPLCMDHDEIDAWRKTA